MSFRENWIKTHSADIRQAAKEQAQKYIGTGVYEPIDNRTYRELKPNELALKRPSRKVVQQKAKVQTEVKKVAERSNAIAVYMRTPPYFTLEVSDAELDVIQLALSLLAAEKHPGAAQLGTNIAMQKALQRTVKMEKQQHG